MRPADELLLAHFFDGSQPDVELLVFGVLCLLLAIVLFFQKNVKRQIPPILVLVAGSLITAAVALGGPPETEISARPSDLSLEIISPTDGAEVAAGEEVMISVDIGGGTLVSDSSSDDPSAGHLHIFVDGSLVAMPTSADAPVQLDPGVHELMVEFTKADHSSFVPRVLDRIEVEAR